jgi:hypothetical protein
VVAAVAAHTVFAVDFALSPATLDPFHTSENVANDTEHLKMKPQRKEYLCTAASTPTNSSVGTL